MEIDDENTVNMSLYFRWHKLYTISCYQYITEQYTNSSGDRFMAHRPWKCVDWIQNISKTIPSQSEINYINML